MNLHTFALSIHWTRDAKDIAVDATVTSLFALIKAASNLKLSYYLTFSLKGPGNQALTNVKQLPPQNEVKDVSLFHTHHCVQSCNLPLPFSSLSFHFLSLSLTSPPCPICVNKQVTKAWVQRMICREWALEDWEEFWPFVKTRPLVS